jgi:hypothetical protein
MDSKECEGIADEEQMSFGDLIPNDFIYFDVPGMDEEVVETT